MSEDFDCVNNSAAQRYELRLGQRRIGFASYRVDGDQVVIPHTEVDPEFEGRGLAGRLVRFALEDIRAQRRQVVPACPYVRVFLQRHPEYADLSTGK